MPATATAPPTRTSWRRSTRRACCAPPDPFGPDDVPGALLVLEADSAEDVTALLDQDPFHREGLVAERTVRAWNIFFGGLK
ncbi:YciI family protein [Streptomyces sp. KL116D]|uniref:YciI family protein n=1 Tax=Streptomyces sp. KL116D TaxID=3045152 RepID=UPI0035571223